MAYQEEQKSSFVLLLQQGIKKDSLRYIQRSLEEMFDLNYILSHRQLKAEIDNSKNGFVRWKFIFSLAQFQKILINHGLSLRKCDEPIAGALIHKKLIKYSRRLRSNPAGVRRLGFFESGGIKYLFARNFPRFSELKQLLSIQPSIINIQEDKCHSLAIISTSDQELIIQKYNGHVWRVKEGRDCTGDEQEELILRVYSHSDSLRFQEYQKEFWSQHKFRSLYRARRIESYPCYRDYLKRRYKDEIGQEEAKEYLTDGIEEEQ